MPGDAAVRPAPGGALGARLMVGAKQVMLLAENHWAWAWERTWGRPQDGVAEGARGRGWPTRGEWALKLRSRVL